MTAKIITVTLNTAVDYAVTVPHFIPNTVLDAESAVATAGGKGINVARALAALGENVLATGFIGVKSEEIFSTVASPLIKTEFFKVAGASRQNITIQETTNAVTTHIRTQGFTLDQRALHTFMRKFDRMISRDDIIVFSGSLPPGVPDNYYYDLIRFCKSRNAYPVLDTSGAALHCAVEAGPELVKSNMVEFTGCFGLPQTAEDGAVLVKMQELVRRGIRYTA